jgi:hypothetical protein
MLPRADDNGQVNVSRKKMQKKKREKNKKERKTAQQKIKEARNKKISVKEAQVFDSGACDIRREGIHCISERSRQLTHEEVQRIYLSIFLSLYPKISAIASGATPIGSAGRTPDDIYR